MTILSGAPDVTLDPAGQRPGADGGDPQIAVQTAALAAAVGNIGVWECQPGGWPVVDRANNEVAYILSGAATMTRHGCRGWSAARRLLPCRLGRH